MTLRIFIVATVTVVLAVAIISGLRQLPTHSEEAKAHAEAVKGLITGLQASLPATDPIITARIRAAAWAGQTPTKGKVTVDLAELQDTVKQLDSAQQSAISARQWWNAASAEAAVRTAKLEALLGDTVWPDQLGSFLRASKDLLLLLGWPLALLLALAYILHSDKARERIAALVDSIKIQKLALPGGVELTLWKEEFRQSQSDTFSKFRDDVKAEYDKLAERYTVKEALGRILKDTFEPELKRLKSKAVDYRATIHVRDALFKNSYYQLIDYLPTGGNRGRAWSVRYGMVGRAWRLEDDSWNGKVPANPTDLIKDWGMTRDESQVPGRQTMLCCILKSSTGTPVGALYMDAKAQDEFGTLDEMKALATKVRDAADAAGLIKSLEAIWEEIKKKAPLVEVYGNRA